MSFTKTYIYFLMLVSCASWSAYKMLLPGTPTGPSGGILDDIVSNSSRPPEAGLLVASTLLAIQYGFMSAFKKIANEEKSARTQVNKTNGHKIRT